MCGAHLSGCLAPAARARHRFVGDLAGGAARDVHGRHGPRQSRLSAVRRHDHAPVEGLRLSGGRHRRRGTDAALRHAARARGLRRHRRRRVDSRGRCRAVSPAPDDPDGRDAPGCGPMGRSDAGRRFVAGVLLRRQHRRRRRGHSAGGLLPAPGLRHGRGDVGRHGAERGGRARRLDIGVPHTLSTTGTCPGRLVE